MLSEYEKFRENYSWCAPERLNYGNVCLVTEALPSLGSLNAQFSIEDAKYSTEVP